MINKKIEDFVAKRIFAEKPQIYLLIIYVLKEIKKCLSIRFNLSCLLAVFLLSIYSIVSASTLADVVYIKGSSIESSSQALCTGQYPYVTTINYQTVASGPFQFGDAWLYTPVGYEYGWCGSWPSGTDGGQWFQRQLCPSSSFQIVNESMICGEGPLESECPAAGTQAAASAGWITTGNVSSSLSVSSSLCTNNSPSGDLCQATCNSGVVARNSVTGESRLECSSYTFTGNQCVPSDVSSVASPTPEIGVNGNNNAPPNNPEDCPPGTGFAQINNTKTCLPGGSEYTDGSTVKTDTTTTTTKTTTTTINSDGTTTSTTTINVTNPEGGIIGSGTLTSTSGIDQAGSDKGKEFDPGPVPIIDTSLPEEGTIPTTTFTNPVFNTNLFQVAGACPAPIAFEAMGQSFSIEFDPICDLSPIIRGIILMLAAIIAIRVVVTG